MGWFVESYTGVLISNLSSRYQLIVVDVHSIPYVWKPAVRSTPASW